MNKNDIIKRIEAFAPPELAEDWDCSGWIVENGTDDIKKVMLALTVDENILNQAKANNCDLIISHHPMFFVPFEFKTVQIYCAHTNLDATSGGTTDELTKILGYDQNKKVGIFTRLVTLETPVTIEDFLHNLKKISKNLRLINNRPKTHVRKIGFCAGSGSEFLSEIEEAGADIFVTGDVKFHTAFESKIAIVDIGHFESEKPVLQVIKNLLNKEVEVVEANEQSPIQNI